MALLFIYGTLKTGECRHHYLLGQRLVGVGSTVSDYRMYRLDGYPGLVEVERSTGLAIKGEIWDVDPQCLSILDQVEGVDENEYDRRMIRLADISAATDEAVQAYFYLKSVQGCEDCGPCW